MKVANQQSGTDQWRVINGKWAFTDQGYEQAELGTFDRVTLLNRPIAGNYRLQAETRFVEGEMGAGLIFNAPTGESKNGATMVSFTGKGSYLQWGSFDESGVFEYQGGLSIGNVSDGKPHTLAVETNGDTYRVLLDNKEMGHDIPIKGTVGGYAGLLASTSHVVFNNVILESK